MSEHHCQIVVDSSYDRGLYCAEFRADICCEKFACLELQSSDGNIIWLCSEHYNLWKAGKCSGRGTVQVAVEADSSLMRFLRGEEQ